MLAHRAAAVAGVAALLAGAGLLLRPVSARAEFGPASLLSATTKLEFEQAEAPALSGGGRYVAFQGSLGSISGVWRRDLQTGVIEPVATAYEPADPALSAPSAALAAGDAAAPSISEDGQYVIFTTTADLEPERVNGKGEHEGEPAADIGCPEVYRRDMALAASEPDAYMLVSALNGEGGEGITFASCPSGGGFAVAGAQAAPGVAISEDGQQVAFTVLSESNLAPGPGCTKPKLAECKAETPPSQVAVRDLETDTTMLVSVTPEGKPTSGGGAFPSLESEQHMHNTSESPPIGGQITGSSAAISGNGTAVAWMGTDVPAQVPSSAPEITGSDACHGAPGSEAEPLWRRIADGPGAVTQRLMGAAGLDLFYNLDQEGEVVCAGTFVDTVSWQLFIPPVLSKNGLTVALLANAPRPATVASAELYGETPTTDVYAVEVEDEPGSTPQVLPLTETPDYDTTEAARSFVDDVAISPSGSRIAFESARTQFTLGSSLTLISPSVPYAGVLYQTYEANLELGTLQRVTVTWDGAEPTGSAGLLSFSGDGRDLAFDSNALNLFYGDAVDASQVFLAEELPAAEPPASQQIGAEPPQSLPSPEWRLDATAAPQPNGSVLVDAQLPSAGTLSVRAQAQLPDAESKPRKLAARNGRRATRSHASTDEGLTQRTIAQASMRATQASRVRLRLRAGKAYSTDVTSKHGVYTILHLSFSAPGHSMLNIEVPVTFHRTVHGRAARVSRHLHGRTRKGAAR
ncbi:MAG TPA: hypothetical protein VGP17_12750 [Solirubrobacteraceae bacterium]|nr:hypothetical protein [Solirubrobacteraceae bacterium]